MAFEGYFRFADRELINVSRTVQLARTLGIDTVRVDPASVAWIGPALGESGYGVISNAPWYDSAYPASAEFAGFIPLSMAGLDDSTLETTTTEYVTSGGTSNRARNKTLPVVASLVLIASTQRGADYGKRWLDRRLADSNGGFCSGATLVYFRWNKHADQDAPPKAHRRDVSVTRASSITRKRSTACATMWWITYTWTANDPFEYGEEIPQFSLLGGAVTGPNVAVHSTIVLTELGCPVYDYSPVYDPLYPALIAPPTVPDFYPAGWDISEGMTFERFWVTLYPVEPSSLNLVPVFTLTTTTEARMVRLSVWPATDDVDDQCDPLFTAIVMYLPVGVDFVIDGEQQVSYVWDGASPLVRRADSLVYGTGALPVQWTSFNDYSGLRVSLDIFYESGEYEGDGDVRVALALVPKSD